MEARPFFRLSIAAVGLRFVPDALNLPTDAPHSVGSSLQCSYSCTVKLSRYESQTFSLPVFEPAAKVEPDPSQVVARFYLDDTDVAKLRSSSRYLRKRHLSISVHANVSSACRRFASCWTPKLEGGAQTRRKCIGKFILPVGMELASPTSGFLIHQGWVNIGRYGSSNVEFHMSAKVDLDPRYILQFDGEPELSPQIVHIQGNNRQPIFSCKFTRDRTSRFRADALDGGNWGANNWHAGGKNKRDRNDKGRKGWLLLIYDLSGSPVAAASMVTPFVPTSGCDRVSRANPGAWLIMKAGPAGEDCWRPWGRLEAWREKGSEGGLGCRFQLMAEGGGMAGLNNYGVIVSETVINSQRGGCFFIDTTKFKTETPISASPVESPQSSGDFFFNLGNSPDHGGFVMSAQVQGEGKAAKPTQVQLAVRHVSCVEDAAVFVALAAAVDLSMDACLPFTKKLSKNFSDEM